MPTCCAASPRAYQHGVADYREAFLRLDAQGNPIVDAKTDAAIAD